jgi:uncharacterized delta-60 repeat protein
MTLPLIAACLALADCSNNSTTTSPGTPTAFATLRFTTGGAPDTSFGGSGAVTKAITPGLFDFALAAAVQPDNSIVVGGSTGLAGQGTIALVRYDTNGTLDTAGFGTAGIVRTPLVGVSASASAIAIQPADSKILVAALTFASPGTTGIALIRYNTNGTLDTTFNAAGPIPGIVTAAIGPGLIGDTCGLALQGDGKIVVAGASQNGNLVLYRYDAAGVLDPLFGTNGTGGSTVTPLTTAAMSPALALSPVTGKIILVGGTNVDQVVVRYKLDGTLDPTFGTAQTVPGIVVTDINSSVNFANAVAVQADDRIVVAGHADVNFNTGMSDISLVRYNADGTLDPAFVGVNQTVPGIVVTDLNGRFDNAFSVALQTPAVAATNILVSGNSSVSGISQTVVLRYTPLGALDAAFGVNGVVGANLVGPSNIASGNAVVMQPSVGIVVAGYD